MGRLRALSVEFAQDRPMPAHGGAVRDFFQISSPEKAAELRDFAMFDGHFANTSELICAKAVGIEFPHASRVFQGRTFRNVEFNHSRFQEITFKSCKFEDCIFSGCLFKDVEFHDTTFEDCNFYKAKFENVYLDIRLVKFDNSFRKTHSNVMLGFYQEMFRNYSEAHQWKFSMFADIERRRWDRYQTRYRISKWKFDKKRDIISSIWE